MELACDQGSLTFWTTTSTTTTTKQQTPDRRFEWSPWVYIEGFVFPLSLPFGRLSRRLQEGRTGVFSWCVISWFYFPWNVNLGNYSSWLVIWRFWMTRKELELLRDFETRVLRIVKVVYGEWLGMRFAIWNLDLALRNFAYFRHSFLGYSKEYPTWLFLWFGKTKFLYPWSVILYLFRSWIAPETPWYDPLPSCSCGACGCQNWTVPMNRHNNSHFLRS